ncbi:hypothetical protein [Nocardiopsis ansamitocini]|uniref:Uncharacterized protein n=1 Tax=Nocardiopsis ansamitocini TaxID=1670832 RepID=A0A9W6P2U0_9ACTN|nr:hypothetical protein [Nocardiopsis ansamitocini]GLU46108.1 hypothetical protein Nans01_04590 [Nocardiopsis ansamitocini]
MAWSWRYERADGTVLADPDTALPQEMLSSKGDAESWLGESWRELRAEGVERVTLLENDAVIYTMSLSEDS